MAKKFRVVPWGNLAGAFLALTIMLMGVALCIVSPDDYRFVDIAQYCVIGGWVCLIACVFCVHRECK